LPQELRLVTEFRSESWGDDGIFHLLSEFDLAWCINDWQDLPPIVETTTDFAYLQLVGFHQAFKCLGRVQRDRSEDLASWACTVEDLGKRLERVYVNNLYAGHAPATVTLAHWRVSLPCLLLTSRGLWPRQPDLFSGEAR